MMTKRSGGRRRRRRSGRFVLLLAVLLVAGWGAYHGISAVVAKYRLSAGADPGPAVRTGSRVVARIEPQTVIPRIGEVSDGMTLLAATRHPATKPAHHKPASPAPKPDPKSTKEAEEVLAKARQLSAQGKLIEARKVLNDFLAADLDNPAAAGPVCEKALELGKKTILGPKVYDNDPLCRLHRVDAGETFVRLAARNKIPYQLLLKVNQMDDPRRLMEGQSIKLLKGPIHLKVIMHDLTMYVFLQDTLFARYDVGLGKNNKTPTGKWLVDDRIRRPVYVDPDPPHKTYGPNDPENPTGGFWIRLRGIEGDAVGKTGFGVHGTTEPESIKKFMSKGCVRLRNEDMAEVFDMLTPGASEVTTLP